MAKSSMQNLAVGDKVFLWYIDKGILSAGTVESVRRDNTMTLIKLVEFTTLHYDGLVKDTARNRELCNSFTQGYNRLQGHLQNALVSFSLSCEELLE